MKIFKGKTNTVNPKQVAQVETKPHNAAAKPRQTVTKIYEHRMVLVDPCKWCDGTGYSVYLNQRCTTCNGTGGSWSGAWKRQKFLVGERVTQ